MSKDSPVTTSLPRVKSCRPKDRYSKAALGRYLAAGLGATGIASQECEAAVVNIDVTNVGGQNLTGINAGIASGGTKTVANFLGLPGRELSLKNRANAYQYYGFFNTAGVRIAATLSYATPTNFPLGASVSSSSSFPGLATSVFALTPDYGSPLVSPNFPLSPASHIGFRVAANGTGPSFFDATQFNYGYFQVTWNASNKQFQILSGAYESTPNTAISVVPEPSTTALAGIGALALGAGAIRRSRQARKAAAERSPAEAV